MFDASALLALLFEAPGAALVEEQLSGGIGVVNLTEVLSRLSDAGTPVMEAEASIVALDLDVRTMSVSQSRRAAELRALTRSAGRSLGDRACLALAAELGLPVITADRQWSTIASAVNVSITVIR